MDEDIIKALEEIRDILKAIDSRQSRQIGTQEQWQQLKEANISIQQ
jgi:hypothetical protein